MAQHGGTSFEDWTRTDTYFNSFLVSKNDALDYAKQHTIDEGLPEPIAVSPSQGKFLNLLVRSTNAKRILEVGTLAGYSTIWMAKDLPEDGKIVSLELEEKHAKVARENLAHAGLEKISEVIVGPAIESLKTLTANESFDFAFIDADKQLNLKYFIEAKRLLRKNGVIVVDNVVRKGKVSVPEYTDESVEGVRELLQALKEDKVVEATAIGTVGDKGWDGFIYAVKL